MESIDEDKFVKIASIEDHKLSVHTGGVEKFLQNVKSDISIMGIVSSKSDDKFLLSQLVKSCEDVPDYPEDCLIAWLQPRQQSYLCGIIGQQYEQLLELLTLTRVSSSFIFLTTPSEFCKDVKSMIEMKSAIGDVNICFVMENDSKEFTEYGFEGGDIFLKNPENATVIENWLTNFKCFLLPQKSHFLYNYFIDEVMANAQSPCNPIKSQELGLKLNGYVAQSAPIVDSEEEVEETPTMTLEEYLAQMSPISPTPPLPVKMSKVNELEESVINPMNPEDIFKKYRKPLPQPKLPLKTFQYTDILKTIQSDAEDYSKQRMSLTALLDITDIPKETNEILTDEASNEETIDPEMLQRFQDHYFKRLFKELQSLEEDIYNVPSESEIFSTSSEAALDSVAPKYLPGSEEASSYLLETIEESKNTIERIIDIWTKYLHTLSSWADRPDNTIGENQFYSNFIENPEHRIISNYFSQDEIEKLQLMLTVKVGENFHKVKDAIELKNKGIQFAMNLAEEYFTVELANGTTTSKDDVITKLIGIFISSCEELMRNELWKEFYKSKLTNKLNSMYEEAKIKKLASNNTSHANITVNKTKSAEKMEIQSSTNKSNDTDDQLQLETMVKECVEKYNEEMQNGMRFGQIKTLKELNDLHTSSESISLKKLTTTNGLKDKELVAKFTRDLRNKIHIEFGKYKEQLTKENQARSNGNQRQSKRPVITTTFSGTSSQNTERKPKESASMAIHIGIDDTKAGYYIDDNVTTISFRNDNIRVYPQMKSLFNIFKDAEFEYKVCNEHNGKMLPLKVDGIAAIYFRHFKRVVESKLKMNIDYCVIIVPTNFSSLEKTIAYNGGKLAGFSMVEIITESSAATCFYLWQKSFKFPNSNLITLRSYPFVCSAEAYYFDGKSQFQLVSRDVEHKENNWSIAYWLGVRKALRVIKRITKTSSISNYEVLNIGDKKLEIPHDSISTSNIIDGGVMYSMRKSLFPKYDMNFATENIKSEAGKRITLKGTYTEAKVSLNEIDRALETNSQFQFKSYLDGVSKRLKDNKSLETKRIQEIEAVLDEAYSSLKSGASSEILNEYKLKIQQLHL